MGEACLQSQTLATVFLSDVKAFSNNYRTCPWYVLKVRTRGEMAVVKALRDRGFAPYCPTQEERRRYQDRMKVVSSAVFPGYVFCQFEIQKRLPILCTPGVEYIVGFAGTPIAIPEEELLHVGRMIQAGGNALPGMVRGQRVRVTHGPLQGVEGVLVQDSTGNRLVVSIELLNQSASLQVDRDQVCPVDEYLAHTSRRAA